VCSSSQVKGVCPGDSLISIGDSCIEYAGLKHTLWELNESERPVTLTFRRGDAEKRSIFQQLKQTTHLTTRHRPVVTV